MTRVLIRCLACLLFATTIPAVDALIMVTSTNQLVRMRSDTPDAVFQITAAITGLEASETVLSLDLTRHTGRLLALGSTGRVYVIDSTTGAATALSSTPAFTPGSALYGMDVDPVTDRLRVIGNDDSNRLLDSETGAVVLTDVTIPMTRTVTACAYSNNIAGAATTTLYAIDPDIDWLVRLDTPGSGTLTDVGSLGVATDPQTSFDISGITGEAYAVLHTSGTPSLYTINLTTGTATLVGAINVTGQVTGMAVGPAPGTIRFAYNGYSVAENAGNAVVTLLREAGSQGTVGARFQTGTSSSSTADVDFTLIDMVVSFADGETSKDVLVPVIDDSLAEDVETFSVRLTVPSGGADLGGGTIEKIERVTIVDNEILPATAVVLTVDNNLVQFNTATPGTIISTVTVSGLQAAEDLLGIDYRPATGQLYALGSTSRLYTINLATGVATTVGSGPFSPVLNGTYFGFDFNPATDRIRVVSNTKQNLRLDPNTGTTAGSDPDLAFKATDTNVGVTPTMMAAAYSNNIAGAASSTLFVLDATPGVLAFQSPPDSGELNTIGALLGTTTGLSGFDIRTVRSTDSAFASVCPIGTSIFFRINLSTGNPSLIGTIDVSSDIRGLALIPGPGSAPPAGSGNTPSPTPPSSGGGGGSGCGVGGGAATAITLLFLGMLLTLRRRE